MIHAGHPSARHRPPRSRGTAGARRRTLPLGDGRSRVSYCPLSMVSGNPVECELDCEYCPPKSMRDLARDFDGLTYLLNTQLGEPWDVNSGLCDVASAIGTLAENVADLRPAAPRPLGLDAVIP